MSRRQRCRDEKRSEMQRPEVRGLRCRGQRCRGIRGSHAGPEKKGPRLARVSPSGVCGGRIRSCLQRDEAICEGRPAKEAAPPEPSWARINPRIEGVVECLSRGFSRGPACGPLVWLSWAILPELVFRRNEMSSPRPPQNTGTLIPRADVSTCRASHRGERPSACGLL